MLKPYTGQKKIVFFCGCGQQQKNCGGYIISDNEIDEYFSVDIDLGMVPHALGIIGESSFSFIPEILFEGGRAKNPNKLESEINRLLCESGKLVDGTTYDLDDNILGEKINGKIKYYNYKNLNDYFAP